MNAKNWSARVFALVLTGVLLLTNLGSVRLAAAAPTPLPELFISTSAPAALPAAPDASATRQAFARLNLAALPAAQADFVPGTQVHLALFADAQFTARLNSREASITGGVVFSGLVDGIADSEVHLAIQDGVLGASISTPQGKYRVRSLGNDLYAIEQLSVNPPGGDGEPLVNPASYGPTPQLLVGDDDGSRIDVMVVYTATARSTWGGTPAIQTLINTAISETNTGYANSQINQRVALVHTAEVADADFPEGADWNVMLNHLTNTDTYADYIQTWRETYKADEVVMLTSRTEWCGLAWLMTGSNYTVFTNGYALVSTACTTGYYSFAHEMGHNMGAHHDRTTAGTGVGFSANYSYGYWMAGNAYRTIMAYNCPVSCTRVNNWSNPSVTYAGLATGVASNPSTGADNHLTLNNTALTVAHFKDGVAAAPSSLVKQTSAANQVKIGWTRNTTDETHTYVERSSPSAPAWTQIADLGNGFNTYTDTNPVCLETNQYRIKIKNGNGLSTYSNTLSVDTCLPTSQLAAAASQERINLSWVDNANNNGITRVERSPNGTSGWVEIGQIVDNTSLFASMGLTCATPYYYRLKLQNWFGYFVYSTNMNTTTSTCGVPQLPTGLRTVGKTTKSLTVQWNDIDGETSYILERSANGTTGWAVVATLNKNDNAFMNSGLAANTPYYYRLKAHNASGDSAYTTNLAATTLIQDVMYIPLVNR